MKAIYVGLCAVLGIAGALTVEAAAQNVAVPLAGIRARSIDHSIVIASLAGAALNSDLLKGGGSDDTDVLQATLNRAADGTPVHLILDGAALVSGLNLYGNTTLECINGGGLYLKDGSSRAILRNAHR